MKNNLLMDFVVDKTQNKVYVTREFAADLPLVWDAWTTPEILDQWWAPKPYKAVTREMNFTEGGHWLYYMLSPENEKHWCRNDYEKIYPQSGFESVDAFCDEQGTVNTAFPRTRWKTGFTETNQVTTVHIESTYQSLADLELIISMGFKEGFTMALENLDDYIQERFRLTNELHTQTPRVTTYLNFDGNTEEAFLFYKEVFRSEFLGKGLERFGDIPKKEGNPPIPDAIKNMILHVELPILGGHVLMATDAPKEMGFELKYGDNMHINLQPESREETQRLFDELSTGGTVIMPLKDMFFGYFYGQCTDKYGINWMFHHKNP